ncbi:hypothetical protein B0H65DRAFT_545467 [Neurospora tetraspora]|uniref:Uncharacterized protein n=1 Tax=Neurospora tetraspora TaxID=94610 RepID=A0AAE0JRW2_9PEZI|nr:hypothetical protein B0H65DRAFT_545467 [Neurospora tetraspora]
MSSSSVAEFLIDGEKSIPLRLTTVTYIDAEKSTTVVPVITMSTSVDEIVQQSVIVLTVTGPLAPETTSSSTTSQDAPTTSTSSSSSTKSSSSFSTKSSSSSSTKSSSSSSTKSSTTSEQGPIVVTSVYTVYPSTSTSTSSLSSSSSSSSMLQPEPSTEYITVASTQSAKPEIVVVEPRESAQVVTVVSTQSGKPDIIVVQPKGSAQPDPGTQFVTIISTQSATPKVIIVEPKQATSAVTKEVEPTAVMTTFETSTKTSTRTHWITPTQPVYASTVVVTASNSHPFGVGASHTPANYYDHDAADGDPGGAQWAKGVHTNPEDLSAQFTHATPPTWPTWPTPAVYVRAQATSTSLSTVEVTSVVDVTSPVDTQEKPDIEPRDWNLPEEPKRFKKTTLSGTRKPPYPTYGPPITWPKITPKKTTITGKGTRKPSRTRKPSPKHTLTTASKAKPSQQPLVLTVYTTSTHTSYRTRTLTHGLRIGENQPDLQARNTLLPTSTALPHVPGAEAPALNLEPKRSDENNDKDGNVYLAKRDFWDGVKKGLCFLVLCNDDSSESDRWKQGEEALQSGKNNNNNNNNKMKQSAEDPSSISITSYSSPTAASASESASESESESEFAAGVTPAPALHVDLEPNVRKRSENNENNEEGNTDMNVDLAKDGFWDDVGQGVRNFFTEEFWDDVGHGVRNFFCGLVPCDP